MPENELNTLEISGDPTPAPPETPTEPETPEKDGEQTPQDEGQVDETPDPAALQADIEKLRKAKEKAQEDAKYWRQEKARARAEYFKSPREPAKQPLPAESASRPKPDDFEDYNDYVDKLTDWKVEQQRIKWEREAAERAKNESVQQKEARLQAEIAKGFEKYEDFEDVALDQTVPITEMVKDILAESEMPADVVYYLGKHRTEAIAIARMTPIAAARAIQKIEIGLASTQNNPQSTKKITKAPPPIKPVGASGSFEKNPEDMTVKEFDAWRRSKGAKPY